MLLDAGGTSNAAFARECGSLLSAAFVSARAIMARRVRGRHLPLASAATIVAIIALATVTSSNPTSRVGGDWSSIRAIARELAPRLRPGDLVFLAQPDEATLAHDYLPDRLRYATPFGANDYPGWLSQFAYRPCQPTPTGRFRPVDSDSRSGAALALHPPRHRDEGGVVQ